MDIGLIFTILLNQPITNLLVACFQLLQFLHIPYPLGFSIIALTFIIRLILYPFTASQIKTSKKMQDMAPHISKLKEKHKNDKKKQQEEMMKLYAEFGINPAAGCLPVIIQIPIIWGLYHVLNSVVATNTVEKLKEVNQLLYADGLRLTKLWETTFFGIPLSQAPSALMKDMPLIILVPILTGVLQLIFSKMMAPEKGYQGKADDFQATFAKQSLFIFPIMIGFFSFQLPFGLSLYWNAFTLFGILQQYFLVGLGGLKQWQATANKIYGKRN
ncbi:MAG: YidC/Oxa1 family membrane protein insertase [Candidatus Levybacteria bacterium]|nr:YidC/Oxa1 family membrane protein insertase [Candidatus Levybacteria bacterium]